MPSSSKGGNSSQNRVEMGDAITHNVATDATSKSPEEEESHSASQVLNSVSSFLLQNNRKCVHDCVYINVCVCVDSCLA